MPCDGDVPVLFIESDPKRSQVAEQAGHTVVFGDPLDDRTMQRAGMELVGTVIGLTFSEHANSLFVREAREAYGVAHGYVAGGGPGPGGPVRHTHDPSR